MYLKIYSFASFLTFLFSLFFLSIKILGLQQKFKLRNCEKITYIGGKKITMDAGRFWCHTSAYILLLICLELESHGLSFSKEKIWSNSIFYFYFIYLFFLGGLNR